jgi:hypothetical protein
MAAKIKRTKPNWRDLWNRLRTAFAIAGRKRDVAVLDNYGNRKEHICRRLNVVCPADVVRIGAELKKRSSLASKGSAS